jgi:hypothetical protein
VSDAHIMYALADMHHVIEHCGKNPDIVAPLPKSRAQRVGTRRLAPDMERLLSDVIDTWAAKAEHLPVVWILEECKRRTRSARLRMPSRRAVDARLRDRGLDSLGRRPFVSKGNAADVLTPRSRKALEIVQMDHTLVDVIVVEPAGHHILEPCRTWKVQK